MKAQFLKIAGANSEDEFYNMYPTEEAFFQAHPEARQMANGGQPYPWSYPEYGMQGKGAGAQIPVETWFNYGGSSNGPLGYFDDGGSAWNYGQFPAFAKKGNQVQGGKIDNVVDANKNNFLSAIQNNSNKALMNEASDEAFQMTQFAQFGQQIGSRFNPNMYNQNMFEDRLNYMNDESRYTNRNTLGMAKFLTNNAINRKMKSIADQQKAQDEYYKNLETESGFKDAQTVPGFDPIPNNMAKYGGSLKKYQTAGATEYKSPALPVSDLDINKIIADTQKAGKTAAQKRKDQEDLVDIQAAKDARDRAIKRYTENAEVYTEAPAIGEDFLENVKYWDDEYKKLYSAYNAERGIPLYSKVPGELKGNFIENRQLTADQLPPEFRPNPEFTPNYGTFNPGSSNAYILPTPAPATPAPKTPKAPAKPASAPKAPAAQPKYTKESVRTIYNY